jgi:hypothetical protein
VVADAGYEFYRRILAAQQSFLLRVGSNVHLLKELGYIEQEGRDTMWRALTRRHADRGLCRDSAWAVKDGYVRRGATRARDWPPNALTAYFGRRTRSDQSHPFDLTSL